MVDMVDEGFGSDELNCWKLGISGEIVWLVIFDIDLFVEIGCSEINDVYIFIVLFFMLFCEFSDKG